MAAKEATAAAKVVSAATKAARVVSADIRAVRAVSAEDKGARVVLAGPREARASEDNTVTRVSDRVVMDNKASGKVKAKVRVVSEAKEVTVASDPEVTADMGAMVTKEATSNTDTR